MDVSKLIKGCDISGANGNVDFDWLYQQGFRFVFVEAYIGNDSPGSNYILNCQKARDAGLQVAGYSFAYPLPDSPAHANRNPKDQATLHYQHSNNELMCVDIEWSEPQDWNKWGQSASQIDDWTATYLETYKSLSGQTIPVYTYHWFAKAVGFCEAVGNNELWIASYEPEPSIPSPWNDWLFWQYSSTTNTPFGHLDCDYAKDLSFWIT